MNILSAEDKAVCREDVQARPRTLSTRTHGLDSQPCSGGITLSLPLTQGERLARILESMVTWPGPGQSVCSILPGHREWLRTGVVTNQGPGPGLTLESREEEGWFCRKGWGQVRSGYSCGRGLRSAWGSWWPSCARQGRAAGLRRRALLSPGVESAGSCCGPGAALRPEGGRLPVSPLLLVCQLVWTTLDFLSSWLRGDPGNAPLWVLAGFSEEMPDDTGRLQFNLDSGHISWKWSESPSVVSNSWQPHGLYSPWNSAGQNTGVGSLSLLQGIFPVQGLNPGFLQCRKILYQLSPKRSPRILKWVACPFCSGSACPTQESNQGLLMAGGFITSWAIREAQYLLRPAIHWYLLRPDINCRITLISLHGIKLATC